MRSIHRSLAITLVAAGGLLASAGCGSSNGGAECQQACEAVVKCVGTTAEDPATYCALACVVSDAEADASACAAEYAALNHCFASLDPATCADTSPCEMQSSAYAACYSAWCAKQPSQCAAEG